MYTLYAYAYPYTNVQCTRISMCLYISYALLMKGLSPHPEIVADEGSGSTYIDIYIYMNTIIHTRIDMCII